MGIRLGGLASGIDTEALIEAIMGAERRPLQLAQEKKSTHETQQGIIRDLNTRLLALRDAARAIDNRTSGLTGASFDEELLAYQASSDDESKVTATANSGASPGTYDISITKLATSAREVSQGVASATDATISAGSTLSIEFGGTDPIGVVVGAGGASLSELRDLINTHGNNDGSVRAEILFDGTNHRLVLSGRETGAANDLVLAGSLTLGTMGPPFFDGLTKVDAEDASFTLMGVAMTSASNDVTTALPGVSFSLEGVHTGGETTNISVTRDDEAVGERMQSFVDAYNSVRDLILAQTRYNESTESAGPLSGDSTLRAVERSLQKALVESVATGGSFSTMSEIGIRFQDDGRLALDAEVLNAALANDPNGVRGLLGGDAVADTDGVAVKLSRALEPITEAGGTLAARIDGFDDRIGALDQQIERMTARLEKRELLLVSQFSQMEALVASLQSQGGALAGLITQNRES